MLSVLEHITPLISLYQTFDIVDAYTSVRGLLFACPTLIIYNAHRWISAVNEFPTLDNQNEYGPTYVLEYSTREAYGGNITWGASDPLNATWWHLVTERKSPTCFVDALPASHEANSPAHLLPALQRWSTTPHSSR